jgi:hypothetical protein
MIYPTDLLRPSPAPHFKTRRSGRRRKKLLDDLKDRRGNSHLKEEALDRTMWRNRSARGFGPVVRQNTEWMNVLLNWPFIIWLPKSAIVLVILWNNYFIQVNTSAPPKTLLKSTLSFSHLSIYIQGDSRGKTNSLRSDNIGTYILRNLMTSAPHKVWSNKEEWDGRDT